MPRKRPPPRPRKPLAPLTAEQQHLVEQHMGLTGYMIRTCRHLVSALLSSDELFSRACYGLVNAARSYRPEVGAFSTYACLAIRHQLTQPLSEQEKFERRMARTAAPRGHLRREVNGASPELDRVWRQIRMVISEMTPRLRITMERWLDGDDLDDIARDLGVSRKSVTTYQSQAVSKLRLALLEHSDALEAGLVRRVA